MLAKSVIPPANGHNVVFSEGKMMSVVVGLFTVVAGRRSDHDSHRARYLLVSQGLAKPRERRQAT